MAKLSSAEKESRLNEALLRQAEHRGVLITPLGQFGHFFGTIITPISLALKRGETVPGLDQSRQLFFEYVSKINFSPQEKAAIQPIIDLAEKEWTPEVIRQLVELEDRIFP